MADRIAVISGARTPIAKAQGALREHAADDLGAFALKEAVARAEIDPAEYGEVVFGSVAQPFDTPNIARAIALKAGLAAETPAYSVQRNCASGVEAVRAASARLRSGEITAAIAGGTESMSNIPLLFGGEYARFWAEHKAAKSRRARLRSIIRFRPRFLRPELGTRKLLTDSTTGMLMGHTAERLAREFRISRAEQDEYARESHRRATAATSAGVFRLETAVVPIPPRYAEMLGLDQGPRSSTTPAQFAALKPSFNTYTGTVTAANSSALSDGAAALVLMRERDAKERGIEPLGFLRAHAVAALDPARMGLGPAYATARLLDQTGTELNDFELIELNEAFAAVVLANERAFASEQFAGTELGRSRALGAIDRDRLNVNGGAIALGHPLAMSGVRLILHLLYELRRREKNAGLATLCVGGGEGAAVMVEVA